MNVAEQIERGILICPRTRHKLTTTEDGNWLENNDKTQRYRLSNTGAPILLVDEKWAEEYAGGGGTMIEEYSPKKLRSLSRTLRDVLIRDYRTKASQKAFHSLFDDLADDAVCISIGGGPMRIHEKLLNVNIGPFPNVDIVADAHRLPFADNSVDVVHCEAVFEHLHAPAEAAREIFRVLKHGGKAFLCTPFLQPYHGYPHHYQNYTLTGHQLLFETAGLITLESGCCVGPAYTLMQTGATFIRYYIPKPISPLLRVCWSVLGLIVRPFDRILGERTDAYIMASSTYSLFRKS